MFTVEEVWEEQERQYNQLMEEDDQYCHPESFRWGFEHGVKYALTKLGWHPASELPPKDGKYIVISLPDMYGDIDVFYAEYRQLYGWCYEIEGHYAKINIQKWCYPPKEE